MNTAICLAHVGRWVVCGLLSGIVLPGVLLLGPTLLGGGLVHATTATSNPDNLVGHGGPVHAVKLSSDKTRALTGSFDYAMMYWDVSVTPPKLLKRFDDHEGPVKALEFVPGDVLAVSAGDAGKVWMWDLASGKALHQFSGHQNKVVDIAVSADGVWAVSASWDRTARLWNLKTKTAGPVLKGHKGPVQAVQFSADGSQVFTASYDGVIGVWDRASGDYKRDAHSHGIGLNVLQRLPGGNRLVFGALNGTSGIIDIDADDKRTDLPSVNSPILAIALQPKPGLIALAGSAAKGRGGLVRVFRFDDWKLLEEFSNPTGPVWAIDFGPNGASAYYGGLDDFVSKWQVSPRKPFEAVQGKFKRRFQVNAEVSVGQRQFARKCSVCHTLTKGSANRAGPTLYKVFGRKAGAVPGYPYSPGVKNSGIVWGAETIEQLFIQGPDHYTPGSKMPLQTITDETKRKALVAYLKEATQ